MYHAKTPSLKMQEVNWDLLRLPLLRKPKKPQKREVTIQLKQLIEFLRSV
jgi:hypothetical protein